MDNFSFKKLQDSASSVEIPGTNIVEYWFPLRTELHVKLFLPRDLKTVEVARIKKFLEALIVEGA